MIQSKEIQLECWHSKIWYGQNDVVFHYPYNNTIRYLFPFSFITQHKHHREEYKIVRENHRKKIIEDREN